MHRGTLLVGLVLLVGHWLAAGHDPFTAAHQSARMFWGARASGETTEDAYKQLRAEALANAEVRVRPRRKNPGIAPSGLGPAVLTALDQQQAYLASRPRPSVPARNSKHLLPCTEPMIRSVNGNRDGAIFTPRVPGNVYTIEGCSFGSDRGHVQLEPRTKSLSQPALPIVLQLDHSATAWTDKEINVQVDPHLSGVADSEETLVVYPGSGQRLELPGCFFVAMRGQPRLLTVIPATWVRLHASRVRSRSIQQLEYISPPVGGEEIPKDAVGTSALVIRSDSEAFAPGSDTYNFSQLQAGWVVDSVQLQTYAISCPADIAYAKSFGRWDVAWEQRSFTISWKGGACNSYALPFPSFHLSVSQYAAKVWVIGPLGTEPVPGAFHR